jgi:hypothetical protein
MIAFILEVNDLNLCWWMIRNILKTVKKRLSISIKQFMIFLSALALDIQERTTIGDMCMCIRQCCGILMDIGFLNVNLKRRLFFHKFVHCTHLSEVIHHQQLLHYWTVLLLIFLMGFIVRNASLHSISLFILLYFHFFNVYSFL